MSPVLPTRRGGCLPPDPRGYFSRQEEAWAFSLVQISPPEASGAGGGREG